MKIEKIEVKNFRGLKGVNTYLLPQISKMTSKNGTGKSSVIDSVRYVMAGLKPDGELVTYGEKEMYVTVVLNGIEYTKGIKVSKEGANTTFCKVDGTRVPLKDYEQSLANEVGFSLENLKNIMAADILKLLNAKDFGKFILTYIPQKLDKGEIFNIIQDEEMIKACRDMINDDEIIDIDKVNELYDSFFAIRKELKARLNTVESCIKELPPVDTSINEEELAAEERELLVFDEKLKSYNEAVLRFEKDCKQLQSLKDSFAKYKDEFQKLSATKPNPQDLEIIRNEKKNKSQSIADTKAAIKAAETSNVTLKKSREAIASNKCPFSKQIVCTTDKTDIIKRIDETIKLNNEIIKTQTRLISELQKELEKVENREIAYMENERVYEKMSHLKNQLMEIKKNAEMIKPENPGKKPNFDNMETRKERVKALKSILESRDKREKYESELLKLQKEVATYQNLVKAFSSGGEVYECIMEYYSQILDDAVNKNAVKLKENMKIHFQPKSGLNVLCDVGNGFVSYDSLSKGEQTNVLFLIIDLINQLSGSKILFLDEMSVLDNESYDRLVAAIIEHMDEYDHIILSGVHGNEVLEKYDIPELQRF